MGYEESLGHREWIDLWKALHAGLWARYAGSEANEKMLLEGSLKYRACQTSVDRSFASGNFVRTDNKTDVDDRIEDQQRRAAHEAELDAAATVDLAFIEQAMRLSLSEVQYYFYNVPEFRRRYQILARDHGFKIPQAQHQGL